jgi:hypothetical protein
MCHEDNNLVFSIFQKEIHDAHLILCIELIRSFIEDENRTILEDDTYKSEYLLLST